MQTITLPGLKSSLSRICLGTAGFGSEMNERSSFALLDRFAELGGNFIDTAHVYGAWCPAGANGGCGNSELVLGRWLKTSGLRGQMVVGSKGGHPDFATGSTGLSERILLRHLEESLNRLQVEVIDLYWLHRDNRSIPVAEILGWLAEPVRAGRIRAIGCSHWRPDRLAEAAGLARSGKVPPVVASQIAWSLAQASRSREEGPYGEQLSMDAKTWSYHRDSGLAVTAYQSQANGYFAPKYDNVDFLDPAFPKPGLAKRYGSRANAERRRRAASIARERNLSTNQVALSWLLHQPFPTVGIIGPRTLPQLEDSMRAADVRLSKDEAGTLSPGGCKG